MGPLDQNAKSQAFCCGPHCKQDLVVSATGSLHCPMGLMLPVSDPLTHRWLSPVSSWSLMVGHSNAGRLCWKKQLISGVFGSNSAYSIDETSFFWKKGRFAKLICLKFSCLQNLRICRGVQRLAATNIVAKGLAVSQATSGTMSNMRNLSVFK